MRLEGCKDLKVVMRFEKCLSGDEVECGVLKRKLCVVKTVLTGKVHFFI